jgi:putative chitinase
MSNFGTVLNRLWPDGDRRIAGLRAGMVASADEVFARHGIDTPLLVAHVMAQLSHECGAGCDVVENLNYTAARMMQVWPSRFPTLAAAAPYAHAPRALANKVYNGRMGNAPGSDDGWRYRGRGAAQTTGREGYARLAALTGLDLVGDPDRVNDPRYFLLCGVADFVACGCMPFARADDIVGATRRLNGGTIGLAQRRAWLARWKEAMADVPIVASPPLAPASSDRPAPAPSPSPPPSLSHLPSPAPVPARAGRLATLVAALAAAFRRD